MCVDVFWLVNIRLSIVTLHFGGHTYKGQSLVDVGSSNGWQASGRARAQTRPDAGFNSRPTLLP